MKTECRRQNISKKKLKRDTQKGLSTFISNLKPQLTENISRKHILQLFSQDKFITESPLSSFSPNTSTRNELFIGNSKLCNKSFYCIMIQLLQLICQKYREDDTNSKYRHKYDKNRDLNTSFTFTHISSILHTNILVSQRGE